MDLEAMGRHALLFDDDAMAEFVNSAAALVEWNSLLIDRYDVRHLLNAPLPPRAAHLSGGSKPCSSEGYDESELDRERFLDLPPFFDDAVLSIDAESVNANGYHTVSFSYGSHSESKIEKKTEAEFGFLPPFPVLDHLHQNLPSNEKIHQIIARTAQFVVEHGGQSEIVLRVKQGDNPTFGFLMPDHQLHPYFRFLVDHKELIQPSLLEKSLKEEKSASDGALSLLGSMYGSGEEDEEHDGDDVLLKYPQSAPAAEEEEQACDKKSMSVRVAKEEDDSVSVVSSSFASHHMQGAATPTLRDANSSIAEPPMELKRVMDKIVQFVIRNGKEFETMLILQDAKHEKFPFLLPPNQFHSYYQNLLQNAHEPKLGSKSVIPETIEPCAMKKRSASSMEEDGTASDLPDDSDRKGKFKMVIGKQVQFREDNTCSTTKASQPRVGVKVDAAATAAILQAATKGLKNPDFEILSKISENSNSKLGMEKLDYCSVNLSQEQKLKAERLKRAKMFAAKIKSGAAPLKGREGSADSSAPAEKISKNFDTFLDRRSQRRYRSRPTCVEVEEEEDVAVVADEESRKTRRSRRSYDGSGGRRKRHKYSSSSEKEQHRSHRHERRNHHRRYSHDDDDNSNCRLRSNHAYDDPTSSDCNDIDNPKRSETTIHTQFSHSHRRNHRRHLRNSGSHSSDVYASPRTTIYAKKQLTVAEEGEIVPATHQSKRNDGHNGVQRQASVEAPTQRSSMEMVAVSSELRAKVRAMLMANM